MAPILLRRLLASVLMGALIMVPAGTASYPGAWAYVALFFLGGAAIALWLARHRPALLRERMGAPAQHGQQGWDRTFLLLFVLAFAAWLPLMGWDAARTGFAAFPLALRWLGALMVAAYMAGIWWTFRENAFAAPSVRIQADHKVVDSGPYAIVRHPMYASALLFFPGVALLLGSPVGLILSVAFILGLAWRSVREERMLAAGLPGYAAYADRVRFRFVPHIW